MKETVGFQSTHDLMLHVGGIMIAVDGYLDSKTAALFEPYSDEPNKNGDLLLTERNIGVFSC